MYKVLTFFTDLQDDNHPYQPEDIFPRAGLEVSEERLAELSGTNNRRGIVLIEEVPQDASEEQKLPAEEAKVSDEGVEEVKPIKKRKKANKRTE